MGWLDDISRFIGAGASGGTSPSPQPSGGGSSDEEIVARAIAASGGALTGATDDPDVYIGPMQGWTPVNPRQADLGADRPNIVPRSQASGEIYRWDSTRLRQFQERLIDSGLVDAEDIRIGARDATTLGIWRDLVDESALALAAGVTRSPWDLIIDMAGAGAGAKGREQAPFVASVSNPEDIKRGLRDQFREALGSGAISQADLDEMVSEFQQSQVASQRSEYDARIGEGGTVVEPQSFESFADEKARSADPTAYDAYKALDKFSVILNAMGGANAVSA